MLIPVCRLIIYGLQIKRLELFGCHCSHLMQRWQVNSIKVYKTKRFHETNYTEPDDVVENKSMNNSKVINNTIAFECEEECNA